jgi:hypothetical protein
MQCCPEGHVRFWSAIGLSVIFLVGLISCGGGSSGGGGGTTPAMITVEPNNQTVTAPEAAIFSATATGVPAPSYQWQMEPAGGNTFSNIAGATSNSYTTPATSSADNGELFRLNVVNSTGAQTSPAVTLTVNTAQQQPLSSVTVLTYHNDNGRTGQNLNETVLTTANVNAAQFGLIATVPVDGLVDAEPLYVGGMAINGGSRNMLFVATENDSVYAFDADTFGLLWHNQLLSGTTEVPSDDHNCANIQPTIGVTSTPVIDLAAGAHGTIFAVAMSKDTGGDYHQRLHALDLTTGADLVAATVIQASVAGTGTGSSGGTQTFAPGSYKDRAALLLQNGVIYTTWTAHCDQPNYTSWVMTYSESTLAQQSVLNLDANGTTQGGKEGGIWMSGSGPATDSSGNVYLIIGNGTFDTTLTGGGFPNQGDYGNSFVKLSSGNPLTVGDYFTMHNACCITSGANESESDADIDFGSGGAIILPDLQDGQGNTHHLAVGAGKDTNMYIVDRDNMGKFNAANDSAIYQELDGALPGGMWAAPAYFNNTVYFGPVNTNLMAFSISNAEILTPPVESTTTFGYRGATPSISANGAANGLVWATLIPKSGSIGTLLAFNATNLAQLFSGTFTTNTNGKFITPMIANGKVYVGAAGSVAVFGLLNQSGKLVKRPVGIRDRHLSQTAAKSARLGSSTPGD